jgi:Zn-dependent protease with chaperone function
VALAVALTVGFYGLALAVSLGLFLIAYATLTDWNSVDAAVISLCLASLCVACGLSILWSIGPRRYRLAPPGPRLDPAENPDLFAVIQDVATATSQAMPADVYVINAVTAFVGQHGGVMGFRSRRVMGLGLPLMHAVSVQQLKAILAHEFGHFCSGRAVLGPWIRKTYAAIDRTINELSKSILDNIFVSYGLLFMRLTQAVSWRQEFVADELGARTAGADAMISSLRRMHAATAAFYGYWQAELGPIFGSGFRPPVNAGFVRYLENPDVATGMEGILRFEEAKRPSAGSHTHPPLHDRIAALAGLSSNAVNDDRPAACLLSNPDELETRVLTFVSLDLGALKRVEWEHVAGVVYVPMWRKRVEGLSRVLGSCTIATVPVARSDLIRIGSTLFKSYEAPSDDLRIARAWQLIIAALGVALLQQGWTPEISPGTEAVFSRDGLKLQPWSELNAMTEGRATRAEWHARCIELGIADVPLAAASDEGVKPSPKG